MSVRQRVYEKYVPTLLKNQVLDTIGGSQIAGLSEVPELGKKMLEGKTKGRYVVRIDKDLT